MTVSGSMRLDNKNKDQADQYCLLTSESAFPIHCFAKRKVQRFEKCAIAHEREWLFFFLMTKQMSSSPPSTVTLPFQRSVKWPHDLVCHMWMWKVFPLHFSNIPSYCYALKKTTSSERQTLEVIFEIFFFPTLAVFVFYCNIDVLKSSGVRLNAATFKTLKWV